MSREAWRRREKGWAFRPEKGIEWKTRRPERWGMFRAGNASQDREDNPLMDSNHSLGSNLVCSVAGRLIQSLLLQKGWNRKSSFTSQGQRNRKINNRENKEPRK